MRELLFKGKLIDRDEWIEGSLIIDDRGNYYIGQAIMPQTSTEYFCASARKSGKMFSRFLGIGLRMVDPKTVCQYTGLDDVNNNKIFEGDIVKARHHWRLQVYPRDGIDEKEYFFNQKIRGAYGKRVDTEGTYLHCDRYYYFRNYAVEYFVKNGGYRIRNGGQFIAFTRNVVFNRGLEIIGNIHDNPELLKCEV